MKQFLRPWVPHLRPLATDFSWRRALRVFDHYRFRPATIFDIGVGFGTYPLYREFPEAFYYLVDPTPESLPHMQRIARRLECRILNVALGDRDGDVVLEIRSDIQGSTLFQECGPRSVRRRETVALRRFDTVIGEFKRPALCKIDVQGAEMMVLKGMTRRLCDIDAFIIEVSTIATLVDGPELYEIVQLMKENRFVTFDIAGVTRRPLDAALAQLDLVFVREQSILRSDRRWQDAS